MVFLGVTPHDLEQRITGFQMNVLTSSYLTKGSSTLHRNVASTCLS